ncbi:MAG TPA: alpha/beta hydrolase [Desulfuromonadales bacterium]|nr:alpha/beta hydrolase [Desulfuromonadales bacterium]
MPRIVLLFITVLIAVTLLTLSACSPLVNHPGPQITVPKIDHEHFIAADGALLPLRRWLPIDAPATALVIALHGFNDYSNAFASSGSYLSSRGIGCYAYDQRGFGGAPGRGLWSGTEAYSGDLAAFVAVVRTLHPNVPLYLMGESMGGAVTIVTMTGSHPPGVDGVILVAPAVWGRDTMPWYQRWLLAVTAHTVPWLELTGKGLKIRPSDNIEMLRGLGRDPLVIKATRIDTMHGLTNLMDSALVRAQHLRVPTLVQYGEHDQVIPQQPTLLMLEKMPAATKKAFYRNGYHMLLRDLQGEKPLADIVAWITDHNQPLPYGSDTWQGAGKKLK